jgi:Tol biopolymer transport system component
MNGISHKQAVQWIHRRLDGPLDESHLLMLDKHLNSCEFCRTYAAQLDSLPPELQSKFHARWDEEAGPSRKVLEYVTTKARRIPTSNRISSVATLLAGAIALIALAVAINFVISRLQSTSSATNATETASTLPESRLLAFASDQNGNFDIYTVHADGSGLTNLTNHPGNDSNPIWSPDGKYIAFESDRDGFRQIYLINADGSNLARITNEEADHGLPLNYDGKYNPWSPDGSKLVFVQEDPGGETAALYSVDVNGQNKVELFDGKNLFGDISWSPDGNHIAFILNDSPTPRETYVPDIYIVDSDGNQLRELQSFLPEGETLAFTPYYWSSNGQSIVFTSYTVTNGPLRQTLYAFDVITNTFSNRTEIRPEVVEWKDGIALRIEVNQDAMPYVWERPDGTMKTFEESKTWGETCSLDSTRSFEGNYAFGVYCPHDKFNLYWTNADGSTIKKFLNLTIDLSTGGVGDIAWSPDEQYIAFNLTTDEKTEMYVLKVEDALANPSIEPIRLPVSTEKRYRIPSWQPVITEDIAREVSTTQPPSSAGDLLAFASDQNGNFEIYTMHPDGTGLANITNHPSRDTDPVWSPDGKRIAFQSDRDGFVQIYLMNADGSNVVQLTTDETDHVLMHYMNEFSAWSPDGTRLLISGGLPGEEKWQLYVLDVNQGRKSLLIEKPNTLSASPISWSPDGQHIALLSTNPERYESHIYMVNADGSDIREITKSFPADEIVYTSDYHWSPDGMSFFFVAIFQKANSWTAYEARLDDDSLIELATTKDLMYGWWNGTYLVNNSSASAPFEWVHPDGTSSKLNPTEECEHIDLYQSDSTVKRSPNGSWVVTGQCANGDTWLYWTNSEGTQIKRLLDSPISITDTFLIPISWSDDDKFVVFATNSLSDSGDLYILDVSQALQDPSIQPVRLPNRSLPSWQPIP